MRRQRNWVLAAIGLGMGACGGHDGGGSDDGGSEETGITTTSNEKFDVVPTGDGLPGGGDCSDSDPGGMGEDYEFSIIWISNSAQGTVSKIDTTTATELARYRTGPQGDNAPDPSRTSVNLLGDVAVANRAGSITKIAARIDNCIDRNNDNTIQTSMGANDILAWDEDECVLWNHDVQFPQGLDSNEGGPRAVAWDGGDPKTPCDPRPNLWIGWRDQPNPVAKVRRLDGETGNMIAEVDVPDWQGNWGHGTYGGAADADGAFWGLGTLGTVFRVDPKTYAVQRWDNPTAHVLYGIALDGNGAVWTAGWDGNVWRFDPGSETWTDYGPTGGPTRLRGLMIDADGTAWVAGNEPCALTRFDTIGGQYVDASIALPDCSEPVGVSIDYEGFVWVVDRGSNRAYKVDPDDYATVTVEGLVSPYTYSDMTGVALDNIINPPQG